MQNDKQQIILYEKFVECKKSLLIQTKNIDVTVQVEIQDKLNFLGQVEISTYPRQSWIS